MENLKVRDRFKVEFEFEGDAKQGFEHRVRCWIGNVGHSLPCMSLDELEILSKALQEMLEKNKQE